MLGVSVVCCLWLFGEELAGPGGGLCCVAKAFYQQEDSQMLKIGPIGHKEWEMGTLASHQLAFPNKFIIIIMIDACRAARFVETATEMYEKSTSVNGIQHKI